MLDKKIEHINSSIPENIDQWFSDFISQLQADYFLLKEGFARDETINKYKVLISGDSFSMVKQARQHSFFILSQTIIVDYINSLIKENAQIEKFGLKLSNAAIHIWVEIQDDDETTEELLYDIEGNLNHKYSNEGFHISTTIIEVSEKISMPSHFIEFSLTNLK